MNARDSSVRAVVGVLVALFVVTTALSVHGSSIGVWNRLPGGRPDAGVLAGSPKVIRIDEWDVRTPALISQSNGRAFPLENPAWGPARVPLITSLPVSHWSMAARPRFWGFFVLDLERAFAFYWNIKALILLTGVFLLLVLMTANLGVALLGAAWIFFSGFVQWWYSVHVPEAIGYLAWMVVALYAGLASRRPWMIVAATLVAVISVLDFVLLLYPPFLVVMGYLGIAIVVGLLADRFRGGLPRDALAVRVGCAVAAFLVIGVFLVGFYRDAEATMSLMRATVYPGARVTSGGGLTLAQAFGGFYGFFMSEQHFPRAWMNVCEASNFVLLFPVPLAVIAWRAARREPVAPLEWSLAAYVVAMILWVVVGWPSPLASVTGLGMSPSVRSLVGLGVGSILLCCAFMAQQRDDLPSGSRRRALVILTLLAVFTVFGLYFTRATDGFATPLQIVTVVLVGTAASYFLLARRTLALAVCLLVPSIWSYGLVNPIATGLAPILDAKLVKEVAKVVESDPSARWSVYGNYVVADLLKATGANVFNGTKIIPPLDDLRVIDPTGSAASIYNRYAHFTLVPQSGPEVTFRLLHQDAYAIAIDPGHPAWRAMDIRYVILPLAMADPNFLSVATPRLTFPELGLGLYRYE